MKIIAFSDTHSFHDRIRIPDGDMLIFAGDMCNTGTLEEAISFAKWLELLPHKYKIVIPGNHDRILETNPQIAKDLFDNISYYLIDQMIEIEGIRFYGSPWTPKFGRWSFMLNKEQIKQKWEIVPKDIDILITHGPPKEILDTTYSEDDAGCPYLLDRIKEIKPKYHIFGHIHEAYGTRYSKDTIYCNVSIFDHVIQEAEQPIIFNYEKRKEL